MLAHLAPKNWQPSFSQKLFLLLGMLRDFLRDFSSLIRAMSLFVILSN